MRPGYGVPKFLTKIWALVDDPRTDDYICWSEDGLSFIVLDEERFAREVLPKHFKHNNMTSFVRQLNWYGFHKITHDETGALTQDKYGSGRYQHTFFQRGQEELLTKIKRKVSVPRAEETKPEPEDMHKVLAFLHQLQGRQDAIDTTVESLKRENEALWKEVLQLRQKQSQNQPQFDAVSPSQSFERMAMLQANQPLMIDSTGNYNQQSIQKNTEQVFGAGPPWPVNGKAIRGTKRAIKEDHDDSSAEESNPVIRVSVPQDYDSDQQDDSDNSSNFSSSDSEDIDQDDTVPGHRPTYIKLPGSSKTQDRDKIPNKRMKKGTEQFNPVSKQEADYTMSSGAEDTDDHKRLYVSSAHAKKCHKGCRSACLKIENILHRMHRDHTNLTKRVLALEQQSYQKLSEISAVLSNLATFVMNKQEHQNPFILHYPSAEGTRTKSK
ncbi:heat shock factor protein 2-like [Discoglossus pictus]